MISSSLKMFSFLSKRLLLWILLHEKCLNTEFFWSVFSCIWTGNRDLRSKSPYSVWMKEKTDQKTLRISTLFTQWEFFIELFLLLNSPYKKTHSTLKFTPAVSFEILFLNDKNSLSMISLFETNQLTRIHVWRNKLWKQPLTTFLDKGAPKQ